MQFVFLLVTTCRFENENLSRPDFDFIVYFVVVDFIDCRLPST